MFKNTKHNLKKLETLFGEMAYTIRYEKGHFQSGYCIVEDRNVIVINKFFEVDGRINVLLEILGKIPVDEAIFSEASAKLYKLLMKLDAEDKQDAADD
ncbi:MAG: hypothetical protein DHS20C18_52480 [Saprospiraceae bacterium]|nr:MAG: hypothetical protein DHS20C18_52480 [Saprospiraceae bacterium]